MSFPTLAAKFISWVPGLAGRPGDEVQAGHQETLQDLSARGPSFTRPSRFERLESVGTRFFSFFSVVYFSRGTLPTKKETVKGHYWGPSSASLLVRTGGVVWLGGFPFTQRVWIGGFPFSLDKNQGFQGITQTTNPNHQLQVLGSQNREKNKHAQKTSTPAR